VRLWRLGTAAEMSRLVRAALRHPAPSSFVSIGYTVTWHAHDSSVGWGKRRSRGATFLATCRRREGEGKIAGALTANSTGSFRLAKPVANGAISK